MNPRHIRGRQTNLAIVDEVAHICTKDEMIAKFGLPFADPFGHDTLRDAGIHVVDEPHPRGIFQRYASTKINKNYFKTIIVK